MRFKRITGHTKRNYYLGRLAPAFFPCAGAACPVRVRAARFPQASILRFEAFRPSSGQEYGASLQNAIQGKIKAQAAEKIYCTLTTLCSGAML